MNKTNEEFVQEVNNKFNGNVTVIGAYVNQHTKIKFHCNVCDSDFQTTPQSILNSKYGCKKCGNKIVKEKLIRKNIETNGRLIDKYPHIAQQWCYDKNIDIDINNISPNSGIKVWWICKECGNPYQAKICGIVNGSGRCICHSCYLKSLPQVKVNAYIKNKGSFADHYPNLLKQWCYELNKDINPYNLTDKSNKKVWWECQECNHRWKTSVAHRTEGRGCPYCARHTKSNLQIKIEDYIRNEYPYTLLNEHSCTLKCYNPQTGYRLLYDNELIINDNIHLIIECHGQQHYEICGWSYTQSKAEHCSPDEVLQYQQYKDDYKKQFALENGFYYCIISYTDEENDLYKKKIDESIHKILSLTKQND